MTSRLLSRRPAPFRRRRRPTRPICGSFAFDYQRHLEDFARSQFEGVDVSVEVADGDPAGIIEWAAERAQSDLIMMPTRGLGRFRRLLLGSVCAKVLHDTRLPVWTSAHSPDTPPASSHAYRSIVCAIEMNAEAESVVKAATFLAKAFGSRLCVVHMGSSPGASVREAVAGFLEPDSNARVRVLEADVVEGIRRAAFEEEADLIVLGRGHITNGFAPVWSRLYTIVCESPCPVLSV